MDLSPGIEIVWSLAGKEAQIAQMKEIEPEHLFCAVLAFSQMQSAEVMLLEAPMAYKYALIEEIGLVRKSLEEEKINPAQVCEDIRRTLGKGSFPYQGGAVHRSAATRQIFNRASTFSTSSRDFLRVNHLLQATMENPTALIYKSIKKSSGTIVEDKKEGSVEQYINNLAPEGAHGIPVSAASAPQIEVLRWAIQSAKNKQMICLVCDPIVQPLTLLKQVLANNAARISIYQVNQVDLFNEITRAEILAQRLMDIIEKNNAYIYLDFLNLDIDQAFLLLSAIKIVIEKSPSPIITSINESVYNQVMDQLQMDGQFKVIWLHDLSTAEVPTQI